MRDVIVIGAGPTGTAAAKRCAEFGLNTLVLEKQELPRHKVCSGMIMGPAAHALIKQEFGEIPKEILTEPAHLDGYMFHVPGVGSQRVDNFTLLAWRKDLDYWMNRQAQAKGMELWQGAQVTGLKQTDRSVTVEMARNKAKEAIEARFVIAADGCASAARKLLFPGYSVTYRQIYQEGYQGNVDLDRRYFHWFYPLEFKPAGFFTVHHKGNQVILEFAGMISHVKEIAKRAKQVLSESYGLAINHEPDFRRGCLGLRIQGDLISGKYALAIGRVLIAGDAGGFQIPVGGEGIGSGMRSGLLAAEAVIEALKSGTEPAGIYLNKVQSIISVFGEIYPWYERILAEAERGGGSLPEVLRDAYASTLRMM